MTLEKLGRYLTLEKLIQREQEELSRRRDALGVHGANITGMPGAKGAKDRIGDAMPGIIDGEQQAEILIARWRREMKEIWDWIYSLAEKDVRLFLICSRRFLDGLSWEEVGDSLNKSGEACKKHLYRYLESEGGKRRNERMKNRFDW